MKLFSNLFFAFAFLLLVSGTPARAADLVLDAATGFFIDAQINGHRVRLKVDTSASGYIILNPAVAQRVGLRPSMTRARTLVGPVELRGSTKAAQVTIAGTTSERRILWWDRDATPDADGVVSAADLPFDRVTFRFREAAARERVLQLPLQYERSSGLSRRLTVGGQQLILNVSAGKPDSLATAATGAVLAQVHRGAWAGEARLEPLNFAVMRPVRPLLLQSPLPIGGLDLSRLLVRTQDHRGNAQLPAEIGADPDEIVVTANTGKQKPRYFLTLGRDWLAPCSSMTWDNRTRLLILSCRTGA